ncbi:transposase [Prevotella nigrescens]|jgi:ISSpo8 (fragment)|uniref:transposase n=1 Tax=Prevotella nigrescens TaxID=28133 RepID=UPI0003FD2B22|nr:transposase [Prevotella nigrescens]
MRLSQDELFVGGRDKNRYWNKSKEMPRQIFVDEVPVLGMLERGGRVIYTVVRNTSYKQLIAPILRSEKRNVILYMIW